MASDAVFAGVEAGLLAFAAMWRAVALAGLPQGVLAVALSWGAVRRLPVWQTELLVYGVLMTASVLHPGQTAQVFDLHALDTRQCFVTTEARVTELPPASVAALRTLSAVLQPVVQHVPCREPWIAGLDQTMAMVQGRTTTDRQFAHDFASFCHIPAHEEQRSGTFSQPFDYYLVPGLWSPCLDHDTPLCVNGHFSLWGSSCASAWERWVTAVESDEERAIDPELALRLLNTSRDAQAFHVMRAYQELRVSERRYGLLAGLMIAIIPLCALGILLFPYLAIAVGTACAWLVAGSVGMPTLDTIVTQLFFESCNSLEQTESTLNCGQEMLNLMTFSRYSWIAALPLVLYLSTQTLNVYARQRT